MKSFIFAGVLALFFVPLAPAQTASLTALDTKLSPTGGETTLVAIVSYDGQAGAIGWSIVVPDNWTLVKVAGPQPPAIAAKEGASGTLEFAYTTVPVNRAEFRLTVRYPPGTADAKATSTVLVRKNGALKTLTLTPVSFQLQ